MDFFIPGEDRNYFVLNLSKEESWRAVSRDFALVFLNCNYPPTQAWFDEGFADYFSSLRFDNKQVLIGGRPRLVHRTAEHDRHGLRSLSYSRLPVRCLLRRKARTIPCSTPQSWIVMHYLLSQNKLPETGTYFDLVENQHLSVEEAIQKAYGMSSAQFADAVQGSLPYAGPAQSAERETAAAGASPLLGVTPSDQIGSSNQELPDRGRAGVGRGNDRSSARASRPSCTGNWSRLQASQNATTWSRVARWAGRTCRRRNSTAQSKN